MGPLLLIHNSINDYPFTRSFLPHFCLHTIPLKNVLTPCRTRFEIASYWFEVYSFRKPINRCVITKHTGFICFTHLSVIIGFIKTIRIETSGGNLKICVTCIFEELKLLKYLYTWEPILNARPSDRVHNAACILFLSIFYAPHSVLFHNVHQLLIQPFVVVVPQLTSHSSPHMCVTHARVCSFSCMIY